MSSRSKGSSNEREYEALLGSRGYITQRVKGGTKWNKNCDFFGIWDIISFNDGHWLLAQVKSDYRKKVHQEISEWMEKNKPPATKGVYAVRRKNKKSGDRWREIQIEVGEDGGKTEDKVRLISMRDALS